MLISSSFFFIDLSCWDGSNVGSRGVALEFFTMQNYG
jgi:hypothetical protein